MANLEPQEYKQYRRKQIAELADWSPDTDMAGVSISEADLKNGSPKIGDKIARNPKNHQDRWLIANDYFRDNFEEADKLSKLTEGELGFSLPCSYIQRKCQVNYPTAQRINELFKDTISPQLLKKNEEIERLKKEANQKDNHAVEAVQQAKQDERERIEIQHIDAINDYVKGKISFERCAEILDINFYELAEFCTVRRQALQGER